MKNMMTSNKYRQMERGERGRGGGEGGEVKKFLISQTTSFWKQVIPDRVATLF